MSVVTLRYTWLSGDAITSGVMSARPFKAIVLAEEELTAERRTDLSRWLVDSGCVYVMAWGRNAKAWEASVVAACQQKFPAGAVPDERIVMTTSHPKESLAEVFWFAKHSAMHPCHKLDEVLLLHLSPVEREQALRAEFVSA